MDQPHTFDDYTFLNRWGLTFLGIWRDGKTQGRVMEISRKIHVTILFTMMTLLLIPQTLDMYVLRGNINANAETFVLVAFTMTAFFKLHNFVNVSSIFEDAIVTMKKNWISIMTEGGPDQDIHREILLDMAGKARNYTKRYGLLMYSTASMYFVSPFLGMQQDDVRVRKYPFFGWYYFDRFSNFYYGICYASQLMIGIVVGTGNYAMDSIFFVAIYHSCARLRMLQHDLRKLKGEKDNCSNQITLLVKKHQREIRNSHRLEAIFNGSSVQQLLVSCVIICIIGFKLIIASAEGSNFEVLLYIAFMFVALLQVFLYCRPGDELIRQSTAVGDAAFESAWTSLDPESVRKLTVIVARSQRALKMTAGKFYILSLPNFTKILKTSLSFLSLLRAMYTKSGDMN